MVIKGFVGRDSCRGNRFAWLAVIVDDNTCGVALDEKEVLGAAITEAAGFYFDRFFGLGGGFIFLLLLLLCLRSHSFI